MRLVGVIAVAMMLPLALAAQAEVGDEIAALIPGTDEVYRHGYEELSGEDRAQYDAIVEALCHFESNNYSPYYYHRCDLPEVPATYSIYSLIHDLERIQRDVPELYILSSTIPRSDYSTGMYYARVGSVHTPESYLQELQRINAIADSLLAPLTPEMTDEEKLRVVHDGFINLGDYGDMVGADAGNIRGALLNRRAVCEGFARAGALLCQRAGLRCVYVTGQLRTSSVNDTWGNHAWNFVEADGRWYLMDLTTDGGFPGICGYTAFLRGQDYFSENYRLTSSDGVDANLNGVYQSLPELSAKDYADDHSLPTSLPQFSSSNSSFSAHYDLQGRPIHSGSHGLQIESCRAAGSRGRKIMR